MTVKLLTEQHLEFLSFNGGSSESTLVKMPQCWKSHVVAHMLFIADWCVVKMEKDDTSVNKHKRTTAMEIIKARLQMIKALIDREKTTKT